MDCPGKYFDANFGVRQLMGAKFMPRYDSLRRWPLQMLRVCFVIFAVFSLSGCGRPLAGAYRITVNATVDGEPVEIEAVVQCIMTNGLETENPEAVGKRLSNGHVVYVITAVTDTCNIVRGLQGIKGAEKLLPQGTPLMFWSAGGGALGPAEAYLGPSAFTEPHARIRDVAARLSPANLWEARWWLFWAVRTPDVVVPPAVDRWRQLSKHLYGSVARGPIGDAPSLICSAAVPLPFERFAGTSIAEWAKRQTGDRLVPVPLALLTEPGYSLVGARHSRVVGLARGFPGREDMPLLRGPNAFPSAPDWNGVESFLSTVHPVHYVERGGVRTAQVSSGTSQIMPCEELAYVRSLRFEVDSQSMEFPSESRSAYLIFDRKRMGFWVNFENLELRLGWRPAVPSMPVEKSKQSKLVLERTQ